MTEEELKEIFTLYRDFLIDKNGDLSEFYTLKMLKDVEFQCRSRAHAIVMNSLTKISDISKG